MRPGLLKQYWGLARSRSFREACLAPAARYRGWGFQDFRGVACALL